MRVGVLRAELHIPGARSLKAKRKPLKGLITRLQNRFHCAVAEVDHQDMHQRAAVGVSVVAPDGKHAAKMLDAVREFIELNPDCSVLAIEQDVVAGPEIPGSVSG